MDIKVRVNETDMLGHINHASYFTYMEEARIEFLKELGIEVKNEGFTIILASAKCDFISQGYFNQTLEINTKVTRVGKSSFDMGSDIIEKQSGQLIAKGEVVIVYYDIDHQQSAKLPEAAKAKLTHYMESTSR